MSNVLAVYALYREQWRVMDPNSVGPPCLRGAENPAAMPQWPPPLRESWRHATPELTDEDHCGHTSCWRENGYPKARGLYQILQESLPVECLGVRRRQASLSKY